jgi:N-carbamoyl-L-amino-acid hydrolase
MPLDIDADRFRETFEAYSEIGATEAGGLHRLALTDADHEARDLLVEHMEALDLDVRVDELGNTFGRREGRDPDAAPVLIGSHLDSQPYGGRYDGQLGVLTALETLRTFEDEGVETARPVELVNWTNEEGSRFEQAMLGSGVAAGAVDADHARSLADSEGRTLGEELERIGYDGDAPAGIDDVYAYLELHVEQGPTLEQSGSSIGVVDGVFGLNWMAARLEGQANHAGPTAMHDRRDALAAAVDAASEINDLPNRLSEDAVATVGRMDVTPNSINVIPSEVTFTVDVRSYDPDVISRAPEAVEFEVASAAERHGVEYELERLWSIDPLEFSPVVREAVAAGAEAADVPYQHIVSGAGHDANHMASITESGMVFVPSVDGLTHNESEFTEWADCVAGALAYANATLELATTEA